MSTATTEISTYGHTLSLHDALPICWINIAREIWLDAKLNPNVPAFSAVLACSTSMTAAFAAAGMLGGGVDLTMVGGAEVMSRPPIALTSEASKRLTDLFGEAPAAA